jgi:hypothetical protein
MHCFHSAMVIIFSVDVFSDLADVIIIWAQNLFINVMHMIKCRLSSDVSLISKIILVSCSKNTTLLLPKYARACKGNL